MRENPSVVLFGAGAMGAALIEGWLRAIQAAGGLRLTVLDPVLSPDLAKRLNRAGCVLNPPMGREADAVVFAVKPQAFAEASARAREFMGPDTIGVSIMAGVPLSALSGGLGTERVVRAMPNMPGQIGHGITAYIPGPGAKEADIRLVESLLSPLGEIEPIAEERLMDVVTAISGSGPAYVFLLAEVLAAVGEAEGLNPEIASRLARQTVAGAGALMLESASSPTELRKTVTSPGGTTAAALEILQAPDSGLPPLLRRAVQAAAQRSRELGRK